MKKQNREKSFKDWYNKKYLKQGERKNNFLTISDSETKPCATPQDLSQGWTESEKLGFPGEQRPE